MGTNLPDRPNWIAPLLLMLPILAFGPPGHADTKFCVSKVFTAAVHALWTEAKFWSPLSWVDAIRGASGNKAGMKMPVTRRGVLRYLWQLHLLGMDFNGKRILDVGAGESEFAPWVTRYFGLSGTRAYSVDLAAKRGYPFDLFTRADAQKLPYADDTFDLTTSNWFLNNLARSWLNTPLSASSRAEQAARLQVLKNAVLEMIRVTRPGGEIRLGQTMFDLLRRDIRNLVEPNPKIERIDFTPPGLANGCIRIKLRANPN